MRPSLAALMLSACVLPACRGPVQAGPSFSMMPPEAGARLAVPFKPLEGVDWEELSSTKRVESAWEEGKQAPARRSQVEIRTVSHWSGAAEGGYRVRQSVKEVRAQLDGTAVEDPLLVLATRFPVELRIAGDGAFVELINREAVRAAVEAAFPDPAQRQEVLAFFTPEAVEEQARLEWDQKYAGLFGRPLEPAHPLYAVEVTAVGPLPLAYVVERRLKGTAKTALGDAVVLEQSCVQEAGKATDAEAWTAAWEARGKPALDPSLRCEGELVWAVSPFVPLSSKLSLHARPADAEGRVAGELDFERVTVLREPTGGAK